MKKVKEDVFEERKDGCLEFKIWGRPDYTGIVGINAEGKYVPKLIIHDSSKWVLLFVRDWFDRYTLYCGTPKETKEDAKMALSHVYFDILGFRSIEGILKEEFPEKCVFIPN